MASGRLIIPLAEPVLNGSGQVTAGATLTVYATGTTNLAALFADAALSVPIANPQAGAYASNSAGRFTTQTDVIWADSSVAYDVVLALPDGSSLTFDQIYLLGAATNVSGFAPINSPVFTGIPQAPTPGAADNSAKIATTAFVNAQGYAPLNGPVFTGVPEAPTAAPGTNTTQLATTAFALAAAEGTSSFGTSGYIIEASGYTRQWGHYTTPVGGNATVTITFPVAFATACLGASATIDNTGHASSTSTGIVVYTAPSTTTVTFQTVGYQSGSINNVAGFYWEVFGH